MIWSIWVHLSCFCSYPRKRIAFLFFLARKRGWGNNRKPLDRLKLKKNILCDRILWWNKLYFMSSHYTPSCLNYFHSPETCQVLGTSAKMFHCWWWVWHSAKELQNFIYWGIQYVFPDHPYLPLKNTNVHTRFSSWLVLNWIIKDLTLLLSPQTHLRLLFLA